MEIFYARNLVINNRELKHQGLFSVEEIFHTLNQTIEERGYTKKEKKTEDTLTPNGGVTVVELWPIKAKTSYMQLMQKIRVFISTDKQTQADLKGYKRAYQSGEVTFIFDAWILTDTEHRWQMRPWLYFIKSMINKFIYTFPMEAGFQDELVSDTAYIFERLRKLLQTYQAPKPALPAEEDVMRSVEQQIRKQQIKHSQPIVKP